MTTKVKPSVLADTAVTAGTYGGSTQHAVFTVDAQGRLVYAGNATPSIATTQLTGTINATQVANNQTYAINVSGNAATATNGVVTSGSYSDPSWITSLAKSKVGLGNVDNTADASKSVSYATTSGNGGVTSVNGSTGDVTVTGVSNSGSAPIYGARAWARFNGSGTTSTNQTIYGSGNVSSVYKNGTGDYTVNFTTSLPDSNFAVVIHAGDSTYGPWSRTVLVSVSSSSVRFTVANPTDNRDFLNISVVVFR